MKVNQNKTNLNKKKREQSLFQKKLSRIKLLALDVDGVLTDCRVFLDHSGQWRRFFSVRDGMGIKRLVQQGYEIAFITGSKSEDIRARAKVLGVSYIYEDHLDKTPALESLLKESGLTVREIAYMGDDDFDIPILERVAFSATVPDAMDEVFEHVDYITKRPGGNGAVREVANMLFKYGFYSKK